jgi:HD-GYP domain-containing protein (c-di-GMP phosphodiesterase class II)
MKAHTAYTFAILQRVKGFDHLADLASAHHERMDGSGYHRHLNGSTLSLAARMLIVADQFEALTASRPYRPAFPPEKAVSMLEKEVGTGIDPVAFQALRLIVEKSQLDTPQR